jgi:glycosyltransferase involved in cell wall biosynthesis
MDNVSVIIRSKNEQDHIGFAIQSCLDHLNDPEIIVVDNESTDDTLGVVNLFVERQVHPWKIYKHGCKGSQSRSMFSFICSLSNKGFSWLELL